jgi:hypothetical protein
MISCNFSILVARTLDHVELHKSIEKLIKFFIGSSVFPNNLFKKKNKKLKL